MKKIRIIFLTMLIASLFFMDTKPVMASGRYYNTASETDSILFVGDSRTVGLMRSNKDNTGVGYICEIGIGYDWLTKKAADIKPLKPGTALILNLGVNDLGNRKKYVDYMNSMAPVWQDMGYRLYFMTVNPVTPACQTVAQSSVDNFNASVISGLSPAWSIIDTESVLKTEGFETRDGLHYGNNTYKKIYSQAVSAVGGVADTGTGAGIVAENRQEDFSGDIGKGCIKENFPRIRRLLPGKL